MGHGLEIRLERKTDENNIKVGGYGSSQIMGLDFAEVYSSESLYKPVKILFALVFHFKWQRLHDGAKFALGNALLFEEVYVSKLKIFAKPEFQDHLLDRKNALYEA